ncbi:GNAT family N-acetyltransferase [Leptogranulimonas caecicola]|uniref:GNAT family N-acetyltransferase n=1 Tax=Leptogranulimonas caecicola TaxID=2894156 RepID=UPI003512C9AD
MLDEWGADILQAHGDPSPRVLWKCSLEGFDQYKKNLDEEADPVRGRAEAHTRFCMDMDRNRLVGAVQLRFPPPSISLEGCSHIGDGVRPTDRGKGYGTAMIGLALEEYRKCGFSEVMMVCRANNAASAKTIVRNGGVLMGVFEEDARLMRRYRIKL